MGRTALIVVDMLNSYEHADAEKLTRSVEDSLPAMTRLVDRARDEDVLAVYVNDNFGAWNSDRDKLVEEVLDGRFKHLVEPIVPRDETLFVVKARHSIFYQTPLEYLLGRRASTGPSSWGRSPSSASSTRRSTPTSATSRSWCRRTPSRTSTTTSPTPRCA